MYAEYKFVQKDPTEILLAHGEAVTCQLTFRENKTVRTHVLTFYFKFFVGYCDHLFVSTFPRYCHHQLMMMMIRTQFCRLQYVFGLIQFTRSFSFTACISSPAPRPSHNLSAKVKQQNFQNLCCQNWTDELMFCHFVTLQDCRSVVQSNVRLLIFNTIRSAIGIIGLLSSVRQSVRPSICDGHVVYCGDHGRCRGWKLYHRVFRTHFLFTSSDTLAIRCIV